MTEPHPPRVRYAGAIYDRDGDLLYIGVETNEAAVWMVYLGWPDEAEIRNAKAKGKTFQKVFVTPAGSSRG